MAFFSLCVSVSSRGIALSMFLSSSYKDISFTGLKAHDNDLTLTLLHLQKPYFQVRSHPQVLGVRTSTYLSGGGQFNTKQTVYKYIFTYSVDKCFSIWGYCRSYLQKEGCNNVSHPRYPSVVFFTTLPLVIPLPWIPASLGDLL